MKAQNLPSAATGRRSVLHYTGADDDRGGVVSVVRALATADRFDCALGVNPGFVQHRQPPLATFELPSIDGEVINLRTMARARTVARAAQSWLAADPRRIFHGHSRAGLLVAWWLARKGERRVVVSVHCYGRQRWFYRWASRQLGGRLYWLSPAMKNYYGLRDRTWAQCIPGCIPLRQVGTGVPPVRPDGRDAHPYLKSGRVRFGGVGAIVRWKGWHLVLEALSQLSPEVRAQVSFHHIGAPGGTEEAQHYAAHLRMKTERLGLGKIVEWRGGQPSADAFWPAIDCLVVASEREPFSVAVLEALAAGVPVLAADSGGAVDLLTTDKTGWFFRSGDAADLARAIAMLASGPALAQARVTPEVVQPYSAPVVAERWQRVYDAL